jgi:hypothetical protein
MEQLTEVTEDLVEDVASLKISQKLYELDRSWENEQDKFKRGTKNGHPVHASFGG